MHNLTRQIGKNLCPKKKKVSLDYICYDLNTSHKT